MYLERSLSMTLLQANLLMNRPARPEQTQHRAPFDIHRRSLLWLTVASGAISNANKPSGHERLE